MHRGDSERFLRLAAQEYADIIAGGRWFTPLREALDAFVDKVQEPVTGVVRLKLFKGRCEIVGEASATPPRLVLSVTPA
jgi:argininosuccinate synthase